MYAGYQEKNHNVIGLVPVWPAVMLELSNERRALLMPGSLADWTPKFAMAAGTMSSGRPEVWFREDLSDKEVSRQYAIVVVINIALLALLIIGE